MGSTALNQGLRTPVGTSSDRPQKSSHLTRVLHNSYNVPVNQAFGLLRICNFK